MHSPTSQQRAAAIRLLVLDVDGVLTDGRLYFDAQGEALKVFHVRDGAGLVQLRNVGIELAIISGRSSEATTVRMKELGVHHVHQGVKDKGVVLQQLKQRLHLNDDAICCVGDDTPDLPMFALARLAVAVADAHPMVRAAAHHVTQLKGGEGAVREVCDLILQSSVHAGVSITA
jgi:3-deoxy-D-manno-octulosonate 8-phosphate phosphatase (KDO 8-P phosphatase)